MSADRSLSSPKGDKDHGSDDRHGSAHVQPHPRGQRRQRSPAGGEDSQGGPGGSPGGAALGQPVAGAGLGVGEQPPPGATSGAGPAAGRGGGGAGAFEVDGKRPPDGPAARQVGSDRCPGGGSSSTARAGVAGGSAGGFRSGDSAAGRPPGGPGGSSLPDAESTALAPA